MIFLRSDTITEVGNPVVTYTLNDGSDYSFRVVATRVGVQVIGTSPVWSSLIELNQVLTWCHYLSQKIREKNQVIPQRVLEEGKL